MWFSNSNMHTNPQQSFKKDRFWFSRSELGLRFCISDKLPCWCIDGLTALGVVSTGYTIDLASGVKFQCARTEHWFMYTLIIWTALRWNQHWYVADMSLTPQHFFVALVRMPGVHYTHLGRVAPWDSCCTPLSSAIGRLLAEGQV
jgi:hypothetical protein